MSRFEHSEFVRSALLSDAQQRLTLAHTQAAIVEEVRKTARTI